MTTTATAAQIAYIRTLQDERTARTLPTETFEDFVAAHTIAGYTGAPHTTPQDFSLAAGAWDRAHGNIVETALANLDATDRPTFRAARREATKAANLAYYEGHKALVATLFADPATLTKDEASAVIDGLKNF